MKIWTRSLSVAFSVLLFSFAHVFANGEKKCYSTQRATQQPIIDGKLTDSVWNLVEWRGDFIQRDPNPGDSPTYPTLFKVLYDDKNVYILIHAFDEEPDKIERRISRRDGSTGDGVQVQIDSYFDKRHAFSFGLSASGVKGDEYISQNGQNWDETWDPIWYGATTIDSTGWIAEMRIPLSQLRFADKESHVWGFQISRRLFRKQERSSWQFIPRDAPGWVHLFGELHGIEGIKPQKQLEIQPYVVGRIERFEKEEGNPFATGKNSELAFGVDGKIGITSDITLDFTINPDFGQVEADPSQVNLTAYEVFFEERRPFFIEGKSVYDFPVGESEAGGSFNRDNLFYSRRIGSAPHGDPETEDGDYVRKPDQTSILGAFKLTGKNQNGFSWGILESLTAKEEAEIDTDGVRTTEVVEPLTNFLVGRVQQELKQGKTVFGAMLTSTNRNIRDSSVQFLHKKATSAGVDFLHQFKGRSYYVLGKGTFGNVQGSEQALLDTQTSSVRFFQRPDADYVSVDSTRTSLSGSGGHFALGKNEGSFVFEAGATYRSPGLELNDVGFLRSADKIHQWVWGQYRILKPFSIFQWMRINANQFLSWDFGGTNTYRALNANLHMQFKNFWRLGGGITGGRGISNTDLRGGPSMLYPQAMNLWLYLRSNSAKKFQVSFYPSHSKGAENFLRRNSYWLSLRYRPFDALYLSLSPSISRTEDQMQYVSTEDFGSESRYLTGYINQRTYRLQLRIDYSINPNLTLEFWGQPFLSAGEFSQFKRVTDSKASNYHDRYHQFTSDEISFDGEQNVYEVDETQDGNVDYSFDNPDFNFVQFRSNFVIRWEYIPGSIVFLVWTQERTDDLPQDSDNSFGGLSSGLRGIIPHNTFLVKYTYRFIK